MLNPLTCGITPSLLSTTSTTTSVTAAPRERMDEKSAWPGVSRNVMTPPLDSGATAAAAAAAPPAATAFPFAAGGCGAAFACALGFLATSPSALGGASTSPTPRASARMATLNADTPCVMPPASRAATVVPRSASSSVVLPAGGRAVGGRGVASEHPFPSHRPTHRGRRGPSRLRQGSAAAALPSLRGWASRRAARGGAAQGE